MANPSSIFTTGKEGDSRLFYQQGQSYQQIANPQQLQQLSAAGTIQANGARQVLPSSFLQTLGVQPAAAPNASTSLNATPAAPTGASATGGVTSAPYSPSQAPAAPKPLESSPGVFNSSSLLDFYNNQYISIGI